MSNVNKCCNRIGWSYHWISAGWQLQSERECNFESLAQSAHVGDCRISQQHLNSIFIKSTQNHISEGKKRINLLPCGLLSFWVPVLNMAYYFFYLIFDFDFTSWSSIHRCCTLLPGSYPVFHSAPETTLHDQLQASVLPAKEKLKMQEC